MGGTGLVRRDVLAGGAAVLALAGIAAPFRWAGRVGGSVAAPVLDTPVDDDSFDAGTVRRLARSLSGRPWIAPANDLPAELRSLDGAGYRAIRFDPERALWRRAGCGFEGDLVHRGFVFVDRVRIHEVAAGHARRIGYAADAFDGLGPGRAVADPDLGFAGLRLRTADAVSAVAEFLGVGNFRALGDGQVFGTSARGLVLGAGEAGQEFLKFRALWVERPPEGADTIVVHALGDCPGAAAAFRFVLRPGAATVIDVEAAIHPRADLARAGIAPLGSMFLFDGASRGSIDDFRPAVHDAGGLAVRNGRGELLWRPLTNPARPQISAFIDRDPRGYGLIQRERAFRGYMDMEARYERRPNAWIEPLGDWGDGEVQLVEIPSRYDHHDNILASWRPRTPLAAGREHVFAYRIHWGRDEATGPSLARFATILTGAGVAGRRFVLDARGGPLDTLAPGSPVSADVTTSAGSIERVEVRASPEPGTWRTTFELTPAAGSAAELRAQLRLNGAALSEVWLQRWTG